MKHYRIKEKLDGTWKVQDKGFLWFWYDSITDYYDRRLNWTYYQCKDYIKRRHEIANFKPKIVYPPFPDKDPNTGHGV
jgi:hypothetical protein